MYMSTRPVPGIPGAVQPAMVDVPVNHKGRQIGTAVVTGRGEIIISIKDPFDQHGIFQHLSMLTTEGLTLGLEEVKWTANPGRTSTDSQTTQYPTTEG